MFNLHARTVTAKKWPKRDWEATCRRMEMCLQRRSRRSAIIALDSFISEHLYAELAGELSVWTLTPQVDEATVAVLDAAGYRTVADLRLATDDDLLKLRHMGVLRLAKIRQALEPQNF